MTRCTKSPLKLDLLLRFPSAQPRPDRGEMPPWSAWWNEGPDGTVSVKGGFAVAKRYAPKARTLDCESAWKIDPHLGEIGVEK